MEKQICQSCGMPLTDEVLGTEADGTKNADWCVYCYANGAFTQKDCTLPEMIEFCVPFLVQEGMEEARAREFVNTQMPRLKRWKA